MAGAPTKLTPQLVAEFMNAVRAGSYITTACRFVGISFQTLQNWRARGAAELEWREAGNRARKIEQPYVEFVEALSRAEAEAEVRVVMQWQGHLPSNYQACRDFLARRYPERWGSVQTIAGAMEHEHHFSDDEAKARREILDRLASQVSARKGRRLGREDDEEEEDA